MKLKTKIEDAYDGINLCSLVYEEYTDQQAQHHDAAVAHALVMAIDKLCRTTDEILIHQLADEIMAGWGYSDGG